MIDKIKELYECGDETLQQRANYIMTAMAGEPDLTGDYMEHFLEQFLNGKNVSIMCRYTVLFWTTRISPQLNTTGGRKGVEYFYFHRKQNTAAKF